VPLEKRVGTRGVPCGVRSLNRGGVYKLHREEVSSISQEVRGKEARSKTVWRGPSRHQKK